MRTNKACPLYTGSMGGGPSSPIEADVEPPQLEPSDDDMGFVEGTKLTLKNIKVRIFLAAEAFVAMDKENSFRPYLSIPRVSARAKGY